MLAKLFKINRKDSINVWVKKSVIKINKEKPTLIEFQTPEKNFFIFKEKSFYNLLKVSPASSLGILKDDELVNQVKRKVQQDGYFYFNGKKFLLDDIS